MAWYFSTMVCKILSRLPRQVSYVIKTVSWDPYHLYLHMLFCNNRYSWSPSLVHKAEVSPMHIFQLDSHKRSKNHGIAVRKTLTREIFEILDFEEKLDLLDLNSFQFYNIPKIDLLMYIYKAVFRILWLIWGNRFSRTLTGLKKQISFNYYVSTRIKVY